MKTRTFFLITMIIILFTSCKKDEPVEPVIINPPVPETKYGDFKIYDCQYKDPDIVKQWIDSDYKITITQDSITTTVNTGMSAGYEYRLVSDHKIELFKDGKYFSEWELIEWNNQYFVYDLAGIGLVIYLRR